MKHETVSLVLTSSRILFKPAGTSKGPGDFWLTTFDQRYPGTFDKNVASSFRTVFYQTFTESADSTVGPSGGVTALPITLHKFIIQVTNRSRWAHCYEPTLYFHGLHLDTIGRLQRHVVENDRKLTESILLGRLGYQSSITCDRNVCVTGQVL